MPSQIKRGLSADFTAKSRYQHAGWLIHDVTAHLNGNVAHTREAARSVWTPRWLELLHDQANDVRYAVRALAKNPMFSLTVA